MSDTQDSLREHLHGRYELSEVLGEGGMGTVYLARDLKHDRAVAIKTIRPDLASAGVRARFEREISIMAGLQHPHILPLLDSGLAGGTLYYVMPYVEGESLRHRLDRAGRLPMDEVVRIGREVSGALARAHERGVVHRDIKPDNILLTDGHALIMDFGIAKALSDTDDGALTRTGGFMGSPNYVAPEQASGVATPRTDLYSLALVLYEAATGVKLRTAKQPDWKGVPPRLRSILERALQWDPELRPADALEFRRGLARATGNARGNVWLAVATLVLVSVAALIWWTVRTPATEGFGPGGPSARASIAVLPLENLSGDEETEYFSDGMTEDIIAQLSKIGDLRVISRTSVMQYKGTDRSMREIGHELGVGAVLEGSVRREGDRVRIVSQLIDARTDDHLWAETFDRDLTDVFTIQSEVAQEIAAALQATVSPRERSLIETPPTVDVEAHNLYLRGRYLWNRRTRAGLESAVEYFHRAIERDPDYALAYAGLADAYLLLGSYQYMSEREALSRAEDAVDRALELDDQLAEAYASRGQILRAHRDWAGEERAYRRAIALNPSYATAHQWYATLLAALDRPGEALDEIRRAQQLDPHSHAVSVTAGIVRYMDDDYEGAIDQLRRTLELAPGFFSAHVWLMMSLTETGAYDEAMEIWNGLADRRADLPGSRVLLARLYARSGRVDSARTVLDRMEAGGDEPYLLATVYAALGETDRALALLDQSVSDDSWSMFVLFRTWLFYMNVGPWYDPLREDPRFRDVLTRLNFL